MRGHSLAHDTRCCGVGKRVMSSADLGKDDLRVVFADPGDLIEPLDRASRVHSTTVPGSIRTESLPPLVIAAVSVLAPIPPVVASSG